MYLPEATPTNKQRNEIIEFFKKYVGVALLSAPTSIRDGLPLLRETSRRTKEDD